LQDWGREGSWVWSGMSQTAARRLAVEDVTLMKHAKLLGLCLTLLLLLQPASAGAEAGCRMFPETGHQVCGRILEYWNQNGGLPVFSYPIGDQVAQVIDGSTLQAQSFERN